MKLLEVVESKWSVIRQKLARRLLEEHDKVLRSYFAQIYGGESQVQYDSAEWKPAFLRQAREFLFFPLLPREASK